MLLNPFMSQALIIAMVSGYGVVLFLFSFSFRLLWFYDDGWFSSCLMKSCILDQVLYELHLCAVSQVVRKVREREKKHRSVREVYFMDRDCGRTPCRRDALVVRTTG